MSELFSFLLVFIVALALGLFIGKLLFSARFESQKISLDEKINAAQHLLQQQKEQATIDKTAFEKQLQNSLQEKEAIRNEKDSLAIQLSKKEVDFDNLLERHKEQKNEVEQLQEKFTKEFENLANKILDEKSNKFTEQNKENMKNILSPLQDKIQLFEKKVEDTHKESIDYHAALRQQIVGLQQMNLQMSKETLNLTKALKGDSKMQGNWGELILERVLEKSGLEKDREYFVQQSHTTSEGSRVFPDVVINLPDGKKMIVDSKVSLTAYEKYINEEDDNLKAGFLKEHIQSIKRHVEQLGDKNYHDLYQIESPDFVLLFIPMEPAFALALRFLAYLRRARAWRSSSRSAFSLAFSSASSAASMISALTISGVSREMRPNMPERNSLTRISEALCRSARPPLRMKARWRAMSSSSSISVSGNSAIW